MPFSADEKSAWIARVNADREFLLVARWTDVCFQVGCGDERHNFRVTAAKIEEVAEAAPEGSIRLEGSADAWSAFMQPIPVSPNHHVLGMDRRRSDFAIAQGRHEFIQNLRVLTIALNLLRAASKEGSDERL
ncbi:hypothetical protein CTTA_4585 [Comamonas testosteroni]|uniref:Uncharacterized protein n=1 Tax=Comamonas testosteroni TaxID=285 RepID=A0A5A7MJB4_COMTE|nr:hypothetical protein [Comamonas testosteroni]GEQ77580.1 hypothetical protein CTTA_4585 [Comamonas testosteroni]